MPRFLFNPGLPSTTDSKFIKQLRELQESESIDRIPLIPSTPEEMADMLKLCSYVRFKVPQQVRSQDRLQPRKGGLERRGLFASRQPCMAAATAMPAAEPVLPSCRLPGRTPPALLPEPFQHFPFKLVFPSGTACWNPCSSELFGAGCDVEWLLGTYGWQEAFRI